MSFLNRPNSGAVDSVLEDAFPIIGIVIHEHSITSRGDSLAVDGLSQDLLNHIATTDWDRATERVVDLGSGVQAQTVEDGGGQVLRLDSARRRIGADGIG